MTDRRPALAERLHDVHVTLRTDVDVSRVVLGGEPSYVMRDSVTFQCHRFNVDDYRVLAALSDKRTLGETFNELVRDGRLTAEDEEAFYSLIISLHRLNFLTLPIANASALYDRFTRYRTAHRRSRLLAPLFLQVPLFNPDAFLSRTVRWFAPLFTRTALVVWSLLMLFCLSMITSRWHEFWSPLSSMLATKNLVYLWLTLVALKVFHEFGHAYACKYFGGAVPEMGALFIVFTPCAYVDATSAWSLPRRRDRLVISFAGMYFESIIAIIATFVWCTTGPSLLNSVAHRAIFLAGIVTVGFNINPLLRYDGYYILSDLVDIPNLRRESTAAVLRFVKRWLLGVDTSAGEGTVLRRSMLATYGIATTMYKTLVVLAIFTMVALKIHLLGIVLAVLFAVTTLGGTTRRALTYLLRSPETEPVRTRALCAAGCLLAVPLLIALIPVSLPVSVYGVLQRAEETTVFAKSPGFVEAVEVKPGEHVAAGNPICRLDNDEVVMRLVDFDSQLAESRIRMNRLAQHDGRHVADELGELNYLNKVKKDAVDDVRQLATDAPTSGEVLDCLDESRIGSFVAAGTPIARIGSGPWTVALLVRAEDIATIRPQEGQTADVCVMSNDAVWTTGTVERIATAGSKQIGLPELTHLAGGDIAVDSHNMKASTPYFEITLRLADGEDPHFRSGMTALARFQPGHEALWKRLFRSAERFFNRVRQL